MANLPYVFRGQPFSQTADNQNKVTEAARKNESLKWNVSVPRNPHAGGGGLDVYRVKAVGGGNGGLVSGTIEVFASYTYDVYAAEDTTLSSRLYAGVGLTGRSQRLFPVEMTKADYGFGRVVAGTFKLFWVDEGGDGYFTCDTDTEPDNSSGSSGS